MLIHSTIIKSILALAGKLIRKDIILSLLPNLPTFLVYYSGPTSSQILASTRNKSSMSFN